MQHLFLILCLVISFSVSAKLKVGQQIPEVSLSGDLGGKVDGSNWSSKELGGKVHLIFYVDPDEKDTNNHTSEAVAKEKFDLTYYASSAIINMDATWLPNAAIASSLKKKQEKYPNTTYVKDIEKELVKKWSMQDDASNIVLLDPSGKVLFHEHGALSKDNVAKLLKLIAGEIEKLKAK